MIKEIKILSLLAAVIGTLVFASQVSAASSNLEIIFPGKPGPLFSVSNLAPGDSIQKSVTVTNNSENDEMFAFRISQIIGNTSLADVLTLTVKRFGDTLLNDKLADLKNPASALSLTYEKSIIMATYMLCGFANFASIGIQIGGIGSLAPGQRRTLSEFGMKALIGGTLASLLSATIAGMILG